MFKNYVRCVYFESRGKPIRALRIACELLTARVKYNIGPLHYSLFRFADIPKKEWSSYLRNTSLFTRVLNDANPVEWRGTLRSKALFYSHCLEYGLPTPFIVCTVGKSTHTSSGEAINPVENVDQWQDAMKSAPSEIFVKPVDGSHGDGTFVIRRCGKDFVFGRDGIQGSAKDLYCYVLDALEKETALLVQARIRPHPKILEISSVNGLATVRIVTAMVGNKAKVLYACIRLPVGTNIADNFSNGMSGNLAAAVDIDTGVLSEGWYSDRRDWPVMRSTYVHPDTGKQIRGFVLPLWPNVVDLALNAQRSLPKLRTIGWDIAITASGVTLIEGNHDYCINLLQITHQRGLGNELISVIEHETNSSPA